MCANLNFNLDWPYVDSDPPASAVIRTVHEDFIVDEVLGFEPDGEGEHVFLRIEKQGVNSTDVVQQIAQLAHISQRDVGYSGMKDKHALARQWFSVGLAGREPPDWQALNSANVMVLTNSRHRRKLRRGVHQANRFQLRLKNLNADQPLFLQRLERIKKQGVPNYFGEQRFGFGGGNVRAAAAWLNGDSPAPRRQRKSIYLSAMRSYLFNQLLAQRVRAQNWAQPGPGDICMLHGSGSYFTCDGSETDIQARAEALDIHVGLPLWGRGRRAAAESVQQGENSVLAMFGDICLALEEQGLQLGYRSARLIADDFCWQFCDDDELLLDFSLPSGGFATAVLRELVNYRDNFNNNNKDNDNDNKNSGNRGINLGE